MDQNQIKTIRTGVVGVGSMGQNHARVYSEISNLVGIADPDEVNGKKVAAKLGVSWYADYKELYDKVDAVSIAVPTKYHREVSENFAKNAIHILVEKPLSNNLKDAQAIVQASKEGNVKLAVGHVERHNPVISSASKFIESPECGKMLTLCARRFSNYPHRIRDVGVLYDLTIHDVEIILSLVNSRPNSVYVSGGKAKNKVYEDFVNMVINFENDIVGICQTNWLTPMKVRDLSITTTKQFISIDYLNKKVDIMKSEYRDLDNSNLHKTVLDITKKSLEVGSDEPLKLELLDFLYSVKNDNTPLVTGEAGMLAVKIIEAGLKSLESSKIVEI